MYPWAGNEAVAFLCGLGLGLVRVGKERDGDRG